MKSKIACLIILCIFLIPVNAGEVGKPSLGLQPNWAHHLSRGLVGCWLFNEHSGDRVADLSGNRNVGTLIGGDVVWAPGKFGHALSYPGTAGDYVNCGNKASLGFSGDFTVSAYIYHTCTDNEARSIVTKRILHASSGLGWSLQYYGGAAEYIRLEVGDGTEEISRDIVVSGDVNSWIRVTGVFDSDSKTGFTYKNGVYQGSEQNLSLGSYSNAYDLLIGRNPQYDRCFDSLIDHIMIWNRALSASEIAQLYQEPFCMFQRSNIAMWAAAAAAAAAQPDWVGISSTHYDSVCGEEEGFELTGALDGSNGWVHLGDETHWFILDLGANYNITKVRGRSLGDYDPIDVLIYVSTSKASWGDPVEEVFTWQDTSSWVEIDTTDKVGQYIKVDIVDTEHESGSIAFGGETPFTIFDAYGAATTTVSKSAAQIIFIMMD